MIDSHIIDSIEILQINRPERRNALDLETAHRLSAALSSAEANDDVGAIVITGVAPAFCSGSDIKELRTLSIAEMVQCEATKAAVVREIKSLSKPVIAAVEGYALGGGFFLAISCDVVVTAINARWALPEVENGWIPPWGHHSLIARAGVASSRILVWGTEAIHGNEAVRLGVADFAAEAGSALERSLEIARKLTSLPRNAISTTKRFFQHPYARSDEELDALSSREFSADCDSEAAISTLARFGEKR